MDEHEWNFKHAVISAVIGLGLGLVTFGVATTSHEISLKLDAIAALLTGLLSAILSMQILQGRELQKVEQAAHTARADSTKAFDIVTLNSTLTGKIHKTKVLPSVVSDVALHALQEAIKGIDVEQDDYSTYIKGRRLALLCYSHFWSIMVDLQNRSRKPLIARVTHSTSVDILYD